MEMVENPMVLPEYEYKRRWTDEDLAILEDMRYEEELNRRLDEE